MSDLVPAVPPFHSDPDAAYLELGKTFVYVRQLSETLTARAEEANRLDDERLDAQRRAAMLGENLDEARERIRVLELAYEALVGKHQELVDKHAEVRREGFGD